MGNSIGTKRKMARGPSKKNRIQSLTSSNLNNFTVEFPKEIEEDLERRKIESFKTLADGPKKPTRTTSKSALSVDPAHELYERMRKLDVPAMMLPKPWSEVDQILSKHKHSFNNGAAPTPKRIASLPLSKKSTAQPLESQPETIDMSELMDDLDEGDEDDDQIATKKDLKHMHQTESPKSKALLPRNIRTLETSLSFSTIHTVTEVEGGAVTNALKPRNQQDSYRRSPAAAKKTNSAAAIATTTTRKVTVNPRLLARVEAFS